MPPLALYSARSATGSTPGPSTPDLASRERLDGDARLRPAASTAPPAGARPARAGRRPRSAPWRAAGAAPGGRAARSERVVGPVHVVEDQHEPGRLGQLLQQLPDRAVQPVPGQPRDVGLRRRRSSAGRSGSSARGTRWRAGAARPALREVEVALLQVVVEGVDHGAERHLLLELGRAARHEPAVSARSPRPRARSAAASCPRRARPPAPGSRAPLGRVEDAADLPQRLPASDQRRGAGTGPGQRRPHDPPSCPFSHGGRRSRPAREPPPRPRRGAPGNLADRPPSGRDRAAAAARPRTSRISGGAHGAAGGDPGTAGPGRRAAARPATREARVLTCRRSHVNTPTAAGGRDAVLMFVVAVPEKSRDHLIG